MFPSSLKSPSLPRRSDSLNATQQRSSVPPVFLTIEQELHDARRVHSHGQEEDLRGALGMVINRVGELSTMLAEAYKTQADLETQLNLAKSNLKLVIANNEMLEEALRHSSANSKDVGWRRRSGRDSISNGDQVHRHSVDIPMPSSASTIESNPDFPPTSSTRPASPAPSQSDSSRFFKFRFSSSSSANNTAVGPSAAAHLTSPSLPSLPTHNQMKELEDVTTELNKERAKCKKALEEKAALEAELESLSQALFEEANKMVATERIKRAETEEELKEAVLEKEALRSALKLIEGENKHLRSSSGTPIIPSTEVLSGSATSPILPPSFSSSTNPRGPSRSRSSSEVAIKSRPSSPTSIRLPDSPPLNVQPSASTSVPSSNPSASQHKDDSVESPTTPTTPASALPLPSASSSTSTSSQANSSIGGSDTEAEPTPQYASYRLSQQYIGPEIPESPWADVPSASPKLGLRESKESTVLTAATLYSLR